MNDLDPKLQKYIQQEARRIAEEVYASKGTMYGVANTPTHTHNNVDSVSVPTTSVSGFVPLPATIGGVVNSTLLGNQIVTQGNTTRGYGHFTTVSQAVFPVYPLVIVNGNGVGVDSQFNGGDAPEGTLLFFNNGAVLSGLWVRSGGQWYGIGQGTPLYDNTVL